MANITASVKWDGGLKFTGESVFGHTITTDIALASGGEEAGFKPTELLLYAVAGCTGVDVVRILEKQRQELTGLEIEVTAVGTEELPKYFESFKITYRFAGNNLDPNKIAQAIELSETKYCTVSETLKRPVKITTDFEIVTD